ncbi:MAG: iron-containing alcohol dehydrogenase [Pseudomonadota bacterium]
MIEGRVAFGKQDEVVFGRKADEAAAEIAERYGAERVFVMASGTLDRETDVVRGVVKALGSRAAGLFAAMPAHTPREAVVAATKEARAAGADLILTVGGGSVTDGAKAVSLCLANGVEDAAAMDRLRAPAPIEPPTVRQVSIPTTLSAGEFSALCGVTDERTKAKELFTHPLVVPRATILDPAVTLHTPEWLFLSTGVRAVDHCVEGVCSLEAHPYGDAQGLKGLSLLSGGLAAVKADPKNLSARLDCLMGAWLSMGPLASGVPMGASHGIGYVLGALHGVPHGHTSCVMLPAAMRWNLSANGEAQARAAVAMGRANGDLAAALSELIAGLGMPTTLDDVGVGPGDFAAIAEGAMKTPWIPRNPRPIAGPADVEEILSLAA